MCYIQFQFLIGYIFNQCISKTSKSRIYKWNPFNSITLDMYAPFCGNSTQPALEYNSLLSDLRKRYELHALGWALQTLTPLPPTLNSFSYPSRIVDDHQDVLNCFPDHLPLTCTLLQTHTIISFKSPPHMFPDPTISSCFIHPSRTLLTLFASTFSILFPFFQWTRTLIHHWSS